MNCSFVILLLSILAAAAVNHEQATDRCQRVREIFSSAMQCYNFTKVHISVINNEGSLCQLKLQLLPNGQVTDLTQTNLLYIASVSKGMFGAALTLIDEELRRQSNFSHPSLFTTPIREFQGDDFWFLDLDRTKLVTIDDLLSHSTGLGRHDPMWYLRRWKTKEEIFRHTGRLKASAEFRASALYNNLVWTIADLTVQKLTNRTFPNYMRHFLWDKLGMKDTIASSEQQHSVKDAVLFNTDYQSRGFPFDNDGTQRGAELIEAAGGILTTIDDMSKYLQYHIDHFDFSATSALPAHFQPINGKFTDSRNGIFHPSLFTDSLELPDYRSESYARGWRRAWYRGNLAYGHSGTLFGLRCDLDVFLAQKLASFSHVISGNAANPRHQNLFPNIMNKIIADWFLYNQSFANEDNVCSLFKNGGVENFVKIPRRNLSNHDLNVITGSYANYGFGEFHIVLNKTSENVEANFGDGHFLLHPTPTDGSDTYRFIIEATAPSIIKSHYLLNSSEQFYWVLASAAGSSEIFLHINQRQDGIFLTADAFEAGMEMKKNLDLKSWTKPQLCETSATANHNYQSPLFIFAMPTALLIAVQSINQ